MNKVIFTWYACNRRTQYRIIYNGLHYHDEPGWKVERKCEDALGKPSWQSVDIPYWLPDFLDYIKEKKK